MVLRGIRWIMLPELMSLVAVVDVFLYCCSSCKCRLGAVQSREHYTVSKRFFPNRKKRWAWVCVFLGSGRIQLTHVSALQ